MELVYLWVEDYKNIQKQGFNFSPRFNCVYDGDSNQLIIDENNDYIENFFGNNINITAIVGKNGSGKSNLLELIADLEHWATRNTRLFCITIDKGIQKLYHLNFDTEIICTPNIEQEEINRGEKDRNSSISITEIGISFSYLTLSPFLHNINSFYSCGSNMDFLSIYNYKNNFNNTTFNFDSFFLALIPKIANILDSKVVRGFFGINAKPDYLVLEINKSIEEIFPSDFDKILKKSTLRLSSDTTYMRNVALNDLLVIKDIQELHKKIDEKRQLITEKLEELKDKLQKDESKFPIVELASPTKTAYDKMTDPYNDSVFDAIRNSTEDEHITKKMNRLATNRISSNKKKIEAATEEMKKLEEIHFSFAKDDNIYYFSTGELVLLFYVDKLLQLAKKENSFTLLMDESELHLHPDWQKKFIYLLSSILRHENYKRNIIITSHSPFIISDLPKENIIFLKNGEQVKGIDKKQTFGANIHTLLSDSFFMEDGLMGEFAKGKINEIIEFFDNKNEIYSKEKEKLRKIIESIGEAFLKEKLLFMYNEKFPKTKEEQIAEWEAKIESLRADDKN